MPRKSMELRGLVFIIGLVLFGAGIVIPFAIRVASQFVGANFSQMLPILNYSYLIGSVITLFIGLPMIVLGIILSYMRQKKQKK